MSTQDIAIVSSFVADAPPGELANVLADIENLTAASGPGLGAALGPALQTYNEAQFATAVLPGATGALPALVSADSALGGGRYRDAASGASFAFDHRTQKASDVQAGEEEDDDDPLVTASLKALKAYVQDHYARPAFGVYPQAGGSLAVLLVSNKYSPQNFWNGRWRARYVFDPRSGALEGTIRVDVHYYEDGNVRLLTEKPQTATVPSSSGGNPTATAAALAKAIAGLETAYQEELNRKFLALSEGAFKSLRRQLPVTRQKIEWDKVASYRLGQDIGGGSSGRR